MRHIMTGLMILIFSSIYGQNRDSIAVAVLRTPLSHPAHAMNGGVALRLRGVYIHDGLLWFAFDARNRSSVDFRPDAMRFWLQARHTVRREAREELRWLPVYGNGPAVLRSDSSARFVYVVPARAPSGQQLLRLEWVERNGDRRIRLYISAKRIVGARKLRTDRGKNR
jgi:hypothetical protein